MLKYLRKSDWGDYWDRDPQLDRERLVRRSLEIVATLGLQLSGLELPGETPQETTRTLLPGQRSDDLR